MCIDANIIRGKDTFFSCITKEKRCFRYKIKRFILYCLRIILSLQANLKRKE